MITRYTRPLFSSLGLALLTACRLTGEPTAPPPSPPAILSACEIDYPPFCLVRDDGEVDGFSVELLRAALGAMSRDVTFRSGPWSEVMGWLEHGDVEALPLVGRTPEREAIFDFTVPYLTLHGALVVRKETHDIRTLEDLRGRRVGVMKGDNAEEFLRREERGVEIVTSPTLTDVLKTLADSHCDAVLVQRLVALRLLPQSGIKNLRLVDQPVAGFRQDFCFAVKEGDRDTLALLNEGLAVIVADGTHRRLHAKWFAALELPSDRPIVIGGNHNYPPFEYLDEKGRPAGFAVDMTRAIAREMGLDIRIRLGPWTEIVEGMNRGDIDGIQGIFFTSERDRVFDFSPPYHVSHYVTAIRRGSGSPPNTIAELSGIRLVTQAGDCIIDVMKEAGLQDPIATLETQEDVLRAVAEGRYDCGLVVRTAALHLSAKNGWDNLELGSDSFFAGEYCFAVPQGRAALLAELSEGLQVLQHTGEYRQIRDKWLGMYENNMPAWRTILTYAAWGAGPLLVITLLALAWSWSLRKRVAQRTAELAAQYRLLRMAGKTARFGGWSVDLATQRCLWSDTVAEIHDVTPPFSPNVQDGIHFYAPEWQDRIASVFGRCARDGVPYDEEMQIVTRTGRRVWVRTTGEALRNAQGTIVQIQGSFQDITERKRNEEGLRASEERHRALIEGLPDIVMRFDREGRHLFVSRNVEPIVGIPASTFINKTHRDLGFPDTLCAFWEESLKEVFHTGAPAEKEFVVSVGKASLIFNWRLVPEFAANGVVESILTISRDITAHRLAEREQAHLQDQLLQAQKLESVGRLAGGVAHDFNNLLTGIINYVELCRDIIPPASPARGYLDETMRAAQRSAELTKQLLAFARKQTIAPKRIDLNDVVTGILKLVRRLIGEDIDLIWSPGPALWPVVLDPSQVDQLITNLCVNARDAIGGVGAITIETANVTVDEAYCREHHDAIPGPFTVLTVSDNGRGMDKDIVDHVFEPFFTTKSLSEGTGLGLATVYGIAKQNHGFVNVYSEPDRGTTFRIYLPRAEGGEPAAPPHSDLPVPSMGGTETILFVEDEKSVRVTTAIFLARAGYAVLSASTPAEALRLAAEHADPIHLLITDVVMPGMSGRDLASQLAETRPAMKILFISGYTANVIAQRGILDQGMQFLSKPFDRSAILQKVRDVLESPSSVGP